MPGARGEHGSFCYQVYPRYDRNASQPEWALEELVAGVTPGTVALVRRLNHYTTE